MCSEDGRRKCATSKTRRVTTGSTQTRWQIRCKQNFNQKLTIPLSPLFSDKSGGISSIIINTSMMERANNFFSPLSPSAAHSSMVENMCFSVSTRKSLADVCKQNMKLVSFTHFSTFHDSPSWARTHKLVGEFVGFSRSFDVQANDDGRRERDLSIQQRSGLKWWEIAKRIKISLKMDKNDDAQSLTN